MNKLKDFILWLVGTLVIIMLFWLGIKNSIGFLTFISIIGFIFLQVIAIVSLKQDKDDKKQHKEQQKYNEQNISNIEINDERFGKIIIKHDTFKHQYDGEIKNVNIDGELLDVSLSSEDTVNIDKMIGNLKAFCDKAVLMKNRIYSELAEFLKDNDNFDEEDNLIEITENFLRENFKFSLINLYDEETIDLWGSWEDSGSQDYSVKYNIVQDKFEFELL
ncbi:MAG: hypothetical protein ACI4XD_03265 [Clostridia bacterium]